MITVQHRVISHTMLAGLLFNENKRQGLLEEIKPGLALA